MITQRDNWEERFRSWKERMKRKKISVDDVEKNSIIMKNYEKNRRDEAKILSEMDVYELKEEMDKRRIIVWTSLVVLILIFLFALLT